MLAKFEPLAIILTEVTGVCRPPCEGLPPLEKTRFKTILTTFEAAYHYGVQWMLCFWRGYYNSFDNRDVIFDKDDGDSEDFLRRMFEL